MIFIKKAIHKLTNLADCNMTVASLDTLSRYVSPINPAVFPTNIFLQIFALKKLFMNWPNLQIAI